MSRVAKGIFGLLAASLALGAVHLEIAAGSDLKNGVKGDAGLFGTRGVARAASQLAAHDVNRTAKGDRQGNALPGVSGPTIVFTVTGLANTSVATFAPLSPKESSSARDKVKDGPRAIMQTAACEPPVSALTEIAKQMETGRCVT